MSVSKKTVLHTSTLARLDLAYGADGPEAEARIDAFAGQMDQIVQYIGILAEADTAGVEPMFSPMKLNAPLAEDIPVPSPSRDDIMAIAPEHEDGFFIVPRVL